MTKGILSPNGDGTFSMSTGRMRLGRVAFPGLPAGLIPLVLQGTVTGYEDAADGSWSATLDDLKPVVQPAPAPNRPDEFWWAEWCEDMPLEPARISFEGDAPAWILQLGDDTAGGSLLADVPHIRLAAPVVAYAPDQVVISREGFLTMWDALSTRGAQSPSFGWLDSLKARVDARAGDEA